MMKNALQDIKELCFAWFQERDLEKVRRYLAQNVSMIGITERRVSHGREAVLQHIRETMEASDTFFWTEYKAEEEQRLSETVCNVMLEFMLRNSHSEHQVYATFALTLEKNRWMVCQMHLSSISVCTDISEQRFNQFENESLIKAMHGSMGVFKPSGEHFIPLYLSDGSGRLTGRSKEEFEYMLRNHFDELIYAQDRKKVYADLGKVMSSDDYIENTYRVRHHDGYYMWITGVFRKMGMDDGQPLVQAFFTAVSRQFELQHSILENATTGVCVIDETTYELILANEEALAIMNTPMCDYTGKRCYEVFFGRKAPCEHCLLHLGSREPREMRLSEIGKIVSMTAQRAKWMNRQVIIEYLNDITEQKKTQWKIKSLYNNIPGAVFQCKFADGWPILEANDGLFEYLGYTRGEFASMENKMATVIYPEDLEDMAERVKNQIACGKKTLENEIRVICKDGTVKWISIKAQLMQGEFGEKTFYCVFVDITKQKMMQQELNYSENRLKTAIRHAGIQFWEYDIQKGLIHISDVTAKMLGISLNREVTLQDFLNSSYFYPEDRRNLRKAHRKLEDGKREVVQEYRVHIKGEGYCWMQMHYSNIFDEAGKPVRAIATASGIDDYKDLEERFIVAAKQTGVKVWLLDMMGNTVESIGNYLEEYNIEVLFEQITEETLRDSGLIHPDDIKRVWETSKRLYEGAPSVTFEARFSNNKGKYRWTRFFYTCIKTKSGKPIKALGTCIDIHEHVLLKERFDQEVKYSLELTGPDLLTKVQTNITRNIVESYIGDKNTSIASEGASYSLAVDQLARAAVTKEQQREIHRLMDREHVLEQFERGQNYHSIHYKRKSSDGKIFWVNTVTRLYQNPVNGDIMSFIYSFDIDRQKTMEAVIKRVVDTNFEYLSLFNTVTGIIERTIDKGRTTLTPQEGETYENFIANGLKKVLTPEDYGIYISQFRLDTILKELVEKGTYSVSCDFHELDNDRVSHKLWSYNWFDSERTQILCSRRDITDIYHQEQHQKETLAAALAAANQANAAKTDFLSRMSHEIRTPMNAIIGMAAIAAKSIGNDSQVADCISKIGISSRFLLSLINDILDMSRIESGKMLLKNEKIPFEEFINGINTICYTQAEAKDVDYECIIDPVMDDCYIGDAMKLQQVLVNILGNAIKFTGAGGKVTFSAAQRKKTQNDAAIRFIINDTGIGMGEEFLPHIFEPFEQESTGTTAIYGGTGLGLAISKSIVSMMDGKIEVRSIKGVGTEFTVDVKLGITEDEQRRRKKQQNYNFSHLKTLVVDDDVTVCESAILTLKEMGVSAEWVDSGRKAVERIQEKWEKKKYYDILLIDWKMPGMDGIETAKRAREIVGPEVTIIIMTAYDWSAIEHEAKAAGVNLLISKPMFKSSLISAFSRVLGEEEEKQSEVQVEYDFTGRKLLLVEDHPMNVEIAQMLLEDKGFQVEVAENGLRAIELFSKSQAGYYDAILMDIRMPLMDGLQAANNIRHLSNADAKTIPIIAMTANAFDDDVDKSKAAGMNAHLAKPIDPPKLYKTLYDFILGTGYF